MSGAILHVRPHRVTSTISDVFAHSGDVPATRMSTAAVATASPGRAVSSALLSRGSELFANGDGCNIRMRQYGGDNSSDGGIAYANATWSSWTSARTSAAVYIMDTAGVEGCPESQRARRDSRGQLHHLDMSQPGQLRRSGGG